LQYEKWIKDWKTALAENFFLRTVTLLLVVGLILNASVFKKKERIIVVPPQLSKQFWVEKNKVSPEYLEQMGVFLATLGGNLSPGNAEFNVKALSDYMSSEGYASTKAELASQALYIKKNNITQAFFPSAINTDPDKNTVTVEGEVIRNIGTAKVSQEKMVFHVKFKTDNFKLLLDEFYVDYPERGKISSEQK